MDKHELALHHAMKALILIQDELIGRNADEEPSQTQVNDRFTVMIIAYHNMAVEYEYLKQVRKIHSYSSIVFFGFD